MADDGTSHENEWAAAPPGHTRRTFLVAAVFLLTLLTIYRATLIDRGHFAWGDERYFLPSEDFVEHAGSGQWRQAAGDLFEARGPVPPARPVSVLTGSLYVLVQRAWAGRNVGQGNPLDDYDAASACNVVTTLGISICVLLLTLQWARDRRLALLACLCYSLSTNAQMWIRHMVPYDEALLLFLIALCVLSRSSDTGMTRTRIFVTGVLTGLGYGCYPGYYAFVVVNALVAAFILRRQPWKFLLFPAGGMSVALALEATAAFAGLSYFDGLFALGGTIKMGHAPETWLFLPKYLLEVEGVAGVTIGLLACSWLLRPGWHARFTREPVATMALAAAAFGYLFHAMMGSVFEKMVFYGRIIAMYLPFVFIAAAMALAAVRSDRWQGVAVKVTLVLTMVSFQQFARSYADLNYPADLFFAAVDDGQIALPDRALPAHVLWDVPDGRTSHPAKLLDSDVAMLADTVPAGANSYVFLDAHEQAVRDKPRVIGVNLKWMFGIRKKDAVFEPPDGYELIAEALHPGTMKLTSFEGFKPWERRRLQERRYTMRIYRKNEAAPAIVAQPDKHKPAQATQGNDRT
ncbi:MAG: hypothetical protein ACYTHJ_14860 [Planctomycetota bacterium]|jgi:hypothetical protein